MMISAEGLDLRDPLAQIELVRAFRGPETWGNSIRSSANEFCGRDQWISEPFWVDWNETRGLSSWS